MKKTNKVLGIAVLVAVIGFSMAGCPTDGGGDGDGDGSETQLAPSTSGSLTINGLSSYNNKYAIALANVGGSFLAAAENVIGNPPSNLTVTGVKITDGSVTLKVWKYEGEQILSYSGNDTSVAFNVHLYTGSTTTTPGVGSYVQRTVTVSFSNGVGTGSFVISP